MNNYYEPCFYRIDFVVIPSDIELPWFFTLQDAQIRVNLNFGCYEEISFYSICNLGKMVTKYFCHIGMLLFRAKIKIKRTVLLEYIFLSLKLDGSLLSHGLNIWCFDNFLDHLAKLIYMILELHALFEQFFC